MKHKFIKSVSILLVILTFLASFSSCAMPKDDLNSSDSSNLSSDSLQDGSNNTGELPLPDTSNLPDNVFPLFVDGNYTVKVVTANKAKDFERISKMKKIAVVQEELQSEVEIEQDAIEEIYMDDDNFTNNTRSHFISTPVCVGKRSIKLLGRKQNF